MTTSDDVTAEPLAFVLNGSPVEVLASPLAAATDVLREMNMNSVRETCSIGVCGTCTVLLDGAPVSSCILPAFALEGRSVLTVEGLSTRPQISGLQRQFIESQAFQCSFCTPGFLLSAQAFLSAKAVEGAEEDLRAALDGHLCRCGCYVAIEEAVRASAGVTGPTEH